MKVVLFDELSFFTIIKAVYYRKRGYSIFYISGKGIIAKVIKKIGFLRKITEKLINPYKVEKPIAESGDLYYRLQPWIIDTTERFFNACDIANDPIAKSLSCYYRADKKVEIFIKRLIQIEINEFAKWFFYFSEDAGQEKHFFYSSSDILKNFVLKEFKQKFGFDINLHKEKRIANMPFFQLLIYYLNLLSGIKNLKITLKSKKQHISILFNAIFFNKEGLLSNDFFIQKDLISPNNVLFYFYGSQEKVLKPLIFDIIRDKSYKYVFIDDIRVPFQALPAFITERVFIPLYFFARGLLSLKPQYFTFVQLRQFYNVIDRSGMEKLLYRYKFDKVLSVLTGDLLFQVLPVYGQRHNFKTVVYNFGTSPYRVITSDYAFQNADVSIAWGKGAHSIYEKTSAYGRLVLSGFWAKDYFYKASMNKSKIFNYLPSLNPNLPTVTFYDIPYLPHHGALSAETFRRFYEAVLECASWGNVNVILRSKLLFNPEWFPVDYREIFKNIKRKINENGIVVANRESMDPLDCIAISDINISLELGSPATLALMCNKIGLFYNVVNNDLMKHCLFPKYLGSLIFDDTKEMLIKTRYYLDNKLSADNVVEKNDLEPYDAKGDGSAIERFCRALREA